MFHTVTITDVEAVGESFRLLNMQGAGFESVKWIPGQTVQIFLGNFTKRVYTHMNLDPDAGSASFLFYLHGEEPGSGGTICNSREHLPAYAAKESIDFTSLTEPALFFGDET